MTAIILAAGKGERANLSENKVLTSYQGKPLFMHSVELFKGLGFKVVLVINKEDENKIKKVYDGKYVYGGSTRGESVFNGLKEVTSKHVFIHDAARPFLTSDLVKKLLDNVDKYDALFLAKKEVNTVYDNKLNLVNREDLILAETPQVFLTEKIIKAFINKEKEYTDEISLYKDFYDDDIKIIFHDSNNNKVTTKADLNLLKSEYKIGHAYDIHTTTKGDFIYLGGIKIEAPFKVTAHSDGDVLLHAISESILGALGLGDLGTHFPDTNDKYKNLDSKEILIYVKEKLIENNYEIVNIDASVYLEKPKLSSKIKEIKENIANILNVDSSCVNIKAGTNEGVGEIGKLEAIASEAVCLIRGK